MKIFFRKLPVMQAMERLVSAKIPGQISIKPEYKVIAT